VVVTVMVDVPVVDAPVVDVPVVEVPVVEVPVVDVAVGEVCSPRSRGGGRGDGVEAGDAGVADIWAPEPNCGLLTPTSLSSRRRC